MKRNLRINYSWDTSKYPNLTHSQLTTLEGHAEEMIFQMRLDGYSRGELHYDNGDMDIFGAWDISSGSE